MSCVRVSTFALASIFLLPACSESGGGDDSTSFGTQTTTTTGATTDSGDTGSESMGETTMGDGDGDTSTTGDGDGGTSGGHEYAATIYLNFDGAELTSGTDDSRMNTTQVEEQAGVLEPYDASGSSDMHLYVAQEIANDFAPYDVEIVIERPAEGDYTMIVVTPTNNVMAGISGTGPQDCDNANPNNIGFAFFSSESTENANAQAAGISRIIGFTLGFNQVVTSADIMSASNATPNPSWVDQCFAFNSPPGTCLPQHAMHCPEGEQNSHAALMALFGAAP
jgi:hypothetical protein